MPSTRTRHRRLAPLAIAGLLAVGCAQEAPPRGATPADTPRLRAVVISDLNGAYGTIGYSAAVQRVVERITTRWRPDVVIVAGDLIAAQRPELSDARVREMWAAFDSMVAAPLREAGIPLVATLGNHDASAYPAHARDRRIAVEHWRRSGRGDAPGIVDRSHYPLRYTARYGHVFIAVWDATSQESARDVELLAWLRAALESRAARTATHRVVVGHLPLYPVAAGRDRPGEFLVRGDSLRRELESLGATLFVSGHHHAYYPGRRGELTLLHSGALGGGPRPLLGEADARRAVAVLDFVGDSLHMQGYEVAPDGHVTPIAPASLPPVICSGEHRVPRRDLPRQLARCPAAREPDRPR